MSGKTSKQFKSAENAVIHVKNRKVNVNLGLIGGVSVEITAKR